MNSSPKIVEMPMGQNIQVSEEPVNGSPVPKVEANTEAGTESDSESGLKPLYDGETELVLTQKNVSPILPAEIIKTEKSRFQPKIQRSYDPGFCLESLHFGIQSDAYWNGRSDQLARVVQLVEETRLEAELTASLWRRPLCMQAPNSGLEAPLLPTQGRFRGNQERTISPLQPEFSGKRMRLRVVLPGTPEPVVQTLPPPATLRSAANHPEWGTNLPPENHTPCRFECFGNDVVLTLEIQEPNDLASPEMTQMLRREIFHSVLYDGQEAAIFPQWLQNGLADVFAGCSAISEKESSENTNVFNGPLRLYDLPVSPADARKWNDRTAQKAISIVRYSLTSNDGKAFFPFWEQLAREYSAGRNALEDVQTRHQQNFTGTAPSLESVLWENQQETQKSLEYFFRKIESNPQNETFTSWFHTLNPTGTEFEGRETGATAPGMIRVFWNPEVQILNVEADKKNEFSKLNLDDSWKSVFLEMAQVLKLVNLCQKSSLGNASMEYRKSGMVIHEFGTPKEFQISNQEKSPKEPDGVTERRAEGETSHEESENVTPEDLQKLENVCRWFEESGSAVTLNPDGTILSHFLTPHQTSNWFHPKDRAYLLQEFEGKNVLSATFNDDYVLHIILEKPKNGRGGAEIRVLGIEQPEKSEKSSPENEMNEETRRMSK